MLQQCICSIATRNNALYHIGYLCYRRLLNIRNTTDAFQYSTLCVDNLDGSDRFSQHEMYVSNTLFRLLIRVPTLTLDIKLISGYLCQNHFPRMQFGFRVIQKQQLIYTHVQGVFPVNRCFAATSIDYFYYFCC